MSQESVANCFLHTWPRSHEAALRCPKAGEGLKLNCFILYDGQIVESWAWYLVPLQLERSMSSSGVDSMMAWTSDFSSSSSRWKQHKQGVESHQVQGEFLASLTLTHHHLASWTPPLQPAAPPALPRCLCCPLVSRCCCPGSGWSRLKPPVPWWLNPPQAPRQHRK